MVTKKIVYLFLIGIFIFSSFFSLDTKNVDAQTTTVALSGHAWSSTVGWMSLSGSGYGVTTTNTSSTRIDIAGYAWTSTLGWISFESGAVSGCAPSTNQPGTTGCAPYIDLSGSGPYRVRGFARACAVFANGCSGPLKQNSELGGWDGYISLNSGNGAWGWQLSADKTKITGYAWGDSVVGWVDVDGTCTNCTGGTPTNSFSSLGCAPDGNGYIPSFSWTTDPLATSCTLTAGAASVNVTGGAETNYTPTGSQFATSSTGTTYTLSCVQGGNTVAIGAPITVSRCAVNYGYCPAPFDTILKIDAAGSNCNCTANPTHPSCIIDYGFCPAPFDTIKKIDAAGSNCNCTANPTHPSCITTGTTDLCKNLPGDQLVVPSGYRKTPSDPTVPGMCYKIREN